MEGRILASRYRLLQLLGKGGMGTVWRAQHLELGAHVAIKLMDPELAANADWLARFRREAQAAGSLHSPNIVNVFDFGVDEGSPYIAMELLHGETLAQRLAREKRLSPAEAVTILQQVARAVAKAHDAGIAHRDLKPENVFLVRDDDLEIAKVLDFGIAKRTNITGETTGFVRTETGAMLGTPLYMSPEQAAGKKNIDHLTDIWSFGVIACECLIGARIFNADTLGGLVLAICSEPIPVPSETGFVTPRFDAWFLRCVARDRTQRFQSIREASAALIQSISGRASPTAPAPVEPKSTNPDPQQALQPPAGARAEGLNRGISPDAPSAASSAAPAAPEPSAGLPAIVEGVSTAVFLDPTATGASVAPNFAVTAPPIDPQPRHGAITRRRTVAVAAMATIGAAAGVLWFVVRDPSDATVANVLSSPSQLPQSSSLLAPANLAEPSRAKGEPPTALNANAAPKDPASDVASAIEANVAASARSASEPPPRVEPKTSATPQTSARTEPKTSATPQTSARATTPTRLPNAPPQSATPARPPSAPSSQSAPRSRTKIDLAL